MPAVSPGLIVMFMVSGAAQIFGMYLLPLTRGLSQPLPTIGTAAAFLLGVGLMARLVHSGVNLSLLVPVMAAIIPLGASMVGIFVYGEPASLAKTGTLVLACILIGLANTL